MPVRADIIHVAPLNYHPSARAGAIQTGGKIAMNDEFWRRPPGDEITGLQNDAP